MLKYLIKSKTLTGDKFCQNLAQILNVPVIVIEENVNQNRALINSHFFANFYKSQLSQFGDIDDIFINGQLNEDISEKIGYSISVFKEF